MGSSASKASRSAGAAARQYPKRSAPPTQQTQPSQPQPTTNAPPQPPPAPNHTSGPTVRPQARATNERSEAVNLDASDPDFARSLRSLGPVQPNPTLSPSSVFPQTGGSGRRGAPDPRSNPAIMVLDARARLQDEAEKEFMAAGRRGHVGREFLDAFTLRQMLVQRDVNGKAPGEIERALGLKKGVMDRLGEPGVVGLVREAGRGQKHIDYV